MSEPMFRTSYNITCVICGERSSSHRRLNTIPEAVEWKRAHRKRHGRGRCPSCGHWKDLHVEAAPRMSVLAGVELVCTQPVGMGDMCWCGKLKKEDWGE